MKDDTNKRFTVVKKEAGGRLAREKRISKYLERIGLKAPEKKKMEPEDYAKLANEIKDMAIDEVKRKGISMSGLAMRPQIIMGDMKGMGLAGAAGRTITPKQIGKATINAPTQAKRNASSIEQNTQEKGEVEKDDN